MSSLLSGILDGRWATAAQAILAALGLHLGSDPVPRFASPPPILLAQQGDPRPALERVEREIAEIDRQIDEVERGARRRAERADRRRGGSEEVRVGSSFHLAEGERAGEVVVVLGDATIDGEVERDVVVVGGSVRIRGRVGGDVVNVGSGVELEPGAEVDGDVVGVGGGVRQPEGSTIGGKVVPFHLMDFDNFRIPRGLDAFLHQCVLRLRPMALGVGWVWPVWAVLFLVHVLVAALFPRGTLGCSEILRSRPAAAFGTGVLMYPLVLIVAVLLLATGVGVLILPFLALGLKVAGIVGKTGVMHHLGGQLLRGGRTSGQATFLGPLLLGGLLIALLYLVPVVGFLAWLSLGTWALGAATLALLDRDRMPSAAGPAPSFGPTPAASPLRPAPFEVPTGPGPGGASAGASGPGAPGAAVPGVGMADGSGDVPPGRGDAGPIPGGGATGGTVPPPVDPLTLERVGLGRRLAAAAIDLALLFFLSRFLPDGAGWMRWGLMIAYFAGLWVLRGTTVGGLILRIRVVRLDGRPLDVPTALVRSLGSFLSVAVLGLGYFWCAWDPERQTWHDKLAGTAVVQDPGLKSLV